MAEPFVLVRPDWPFSSAALKGQIGIRPMPLSQGCLDEAPRHSSGLCVVGPGLDTPDVERAAGLGKGFRSVTRVVVGHDAGERGAEAGIAGDRGSGEKREHSFRFRADR